MYQWDWSSDVCSSDLHHREVSRSPRVGRLMPVTKDQAATLAQLAIACRPHGARHWDAGGIVAAIGKVKHLSLADVALAVIRAADDRALETPGPIGNPRAHCWSERKADRPAPLEPWNPHEFCEACGRRCDEPVGSDHEPLTAGEQMARRGDPEAIPAAKDSARQALGDAKAEGPR